MTPFPDLPDFCEFATAYTWNGRQFIGIGATIGKDYDRGIAQLHRRCRAAMEPHGFGIWGSRAMSDFDTGVYRAVVFLIGGGDWTDIGKLPRSD